MRTSKNPSSSKFWNTSCRACLSIKLTSAYPWNCQRIYIFQYSTVIGLQDTFKGQGVNKPEVWGAGGTKQPEMCTDLPTGLWCYLYYWQKHALLPYRIQLHTVMPLDVNPIKDAPSIKQCSMGVMWSTGLRLVGDTGIATCCGSCMGWGVSSPFFFTLGACQQATATEGPHVSFYSRTTTVRSGRDTNSAAERALPSAPHGRFPQAAKWRRRLWGEGAPPRGRSAAVIRRLLLLLFPPCRRGGAPGRGLRRSRPPPRKAVGPGCGRAFRRPPPPAAGSAPSPFSLSCSEPGREVGAASRRLIARLPPAGPGMKSGGTAIPSASARSRHDSNTAERRCGAALFLLPAGEAGSCRPGSRSAAWHRRGARRSWSACSLPTVRLRGSAGAWWRWRETSPPPPGCESGLSQSCGFTRRNTGILA